MRPFSRRPVTFSDFCSQFTDKELPDVVKIGKRYFYDPEHLLPIAQEHKWDVFSVGMYLGEERKEFVPTSALIDLLAAHGGQRIVVGNKAAWLFVCNRDILMDGVHEPGTLAVETVVFVTDLQEHVLGIGRVVGAFNSKMRNKTYVKHIFDRGEYLRRER